MENLHPELIPIYEERLQQVKTFEEHIENRQLLTYKERGWTFDDCNVEDFYIDQLRVIKIEPLKRSEASPCIIWLHGGGMVFGQPDDSIHYMLDFVYTFNAVVLIPQYRLAPEHPYPAALEDGYRTLKYVDTHQELLNINPKQIIVSGGSAGGNLALAVSLYARDHDGPAIAGILPLYPMLDAFPRKAYENYTSPVFWTPDKNKKSWEAYIGSYSRIPPYASPLYADLSNLPSIYTFIGTNDLFYDEFLEFVKRLKEVDGKITYHIYEGCTHCFDLEPIPIAHVAKLRMLAATAEFLN